MGTFNFTLRNWAEDYLHVLYLQDFIHLQVHFPYPTLQCGRSANRPLNQQEHYRKCKPNTPISETRPGMWQNLWQQQEKTLQNVSNPLTRAIKKPSSGWNKRSNIIYVRKHSVSIKNSHSTSETLFGVFFSETGCSTCLFYHSPK